MLHEISVDNLTINPFQLIGKDWYLLTAGTEAGWNTMTASWGTLGIFWGKPVVNSFIRTSRHTLDFVEREDTFTLSFFDESYRAALQFCGSHSGRDCDKAKETGLTPCFLDGTTAFAEAKLVLVCKKLYCYDIKPEEMIDPSLQKWYADGMGGYHRCFFGEICKVYAAD